MTGQDAVNTAQLFDERVSLSGVVLTRIDGDARGGAAMSMKAVTGKPIKLLGVGEKWDELEAFHPDRMAGRILGMGDVVSLVEKAIDTVDQEEAAKMAEKFKKGQFDFNDLLAQMQQMRNMGGMGNLMKMLPGLGKLASQLDDAEMGDAVMKRSEAIIQSMTKEEREKPKVLNASRKKRIAAGSGTNVQEVNKLIKQQQQMQTVMKKMRKMGMGKMMGMMKQFMGGQDADMLMQSMDPDTLAKDMTGAPAGGDPLGTNPFAQGGAGGLGANPFAGGGNPMDMMGDLMGGMPAGGNVGRNKSKRKNKKGKK